MTVRTLHLGAKPDHWAETAITKDSRTVYSGTTTQEGQNAVGSKDVNPYV